MRSENTPARDRVATVGERIRDAREAAGMSQCALGIRCGIAQHYISSIECGNRRISVEMLFRIADGIGIPARDLV